MSQSLEKQIDECEEQLKQAMLKSDVSALDDLLAPELIFTNHLGQLMSKHDDIEAHRSKTLKITEITLSDPIMKIQDSVAVVSVKTHISGTYAGVESDCHYRFTRIWSKSASGPWKVIAGHSSIVA